MRESWQSAWVGNSLVLYVTLFAKEILKHRFASSLNVVDLFHAQP